VSEKWFDSHVKRPGHHWALFWGYALFMVALSMWVTWMQTRG
jgi:hypothetical protein